MSYQVLARKYRSRSFDELVGQQHVSQTLANAIEQGRLHHAYLFTGTRGVGKTTIARILAKCLNCVKGITANPCGKCDSCLQIEQGNFIDLVEVDGASKTKVEDTRELLENVQYAPVVGRYKVYLIDEVHMLSNHSFNALLKTLEEPPEHVKFLLATTEDHKIPITILSRCLRFNLRSLSIDELVMQMIKILQQETIEFEEDALKLLASSAKGSMRDALSLLDQAISYSSATVSAELVNNMLGTTSVKTLIQILGSIAKNDPAKLFSLADKISAEGKDHKKISSDLLEVIHQLAMYKALNGKYMIDHELKESLSLLDDFDELKLQLLYQICLTCGEEIHLAPTDKVGFEVMLLRMLKFQEHIYKAETNVVTEHNNKQQNKQEYKKEEDIPLKKINKEVRVRQVPDKGLQEKISQEKVALEGLNSLAWKSLVKNINATGMNKIVLENASFKELVGRKIKLILPEAQQACMTKMRHEQLCKILSSYFSQEIMLDISFGDSKEASVAEEKAKNAVKKQQQMRHKIEQDENVQAMVDLLEANIDNVVERTKD